MNMQFWVIGAEYSDMEFSEPIEGTTQMFGPFDNYQDASQTWRERVGMSRHEAPTRYTIVSSASAAGLAQA